MGKRNAKVFNKSRCCSIAFYNSKASYSYISSSSHTRERQTILSYNSEKCENHSVFWFASEFIYRLIYDLFMIRLSFMISI